MFTLFVAYALRIVVSKNFERGKVMKKLVSVVAVMLFLGFSATSAFAGFAAFTNGDFETGDLTGWSSTGDVAAFGAVNVISGLFSGAITTSDVGLVSLSPAVGGVCSYLQSGGVFPTHEKSAVTVSFKVRYKTAEDIGPLQSWDPFHASLANGLGDINLLSITSSGITPGPNVTVKRLDTNTLLPAPPTFPPFFTPGVFLTNETPTLLVTTSLAYTGCTPVSLIFRICDLRDGSVDSAAFVDDVVINVVSSLSIGSTSPRLNPPACLLPDSAGASNAH